jgi:hypothetical protein
MGAALACNTCGCERRTHETDIEGLRERLKGVGWLCVGETDVCPTCRGKLAGAT